ncbi:hypothetical protein TIFTF001_009650 [Ficus carica]|uniref:Uncharacterized protein n=1 Tax=Ficus carica TaxID=3494 RepID=A0AA88DHJ0_FICCA|nr:hypothetical protein TIFTF001_009650 [Ficus carica]
MHGLRLVSGFLALETEGGAHNEDSCDRSDLADGGVELGRVEGRAIQ